MRPSVSVLLPAMNAPIVLPPAWTVGSREPVLTVVGPEGNLCVSFVAQLEGRSAIEMAGAAWRQVDATFDAIADDVHESFSANGWDVNYSIEFRLPAAESRIATAFVRMLHGRGYVNLLYGETIAANRRAAQLTEILDAWRPDGLSPIELRGRVARRWSENESTALRAFMAASMRALQVPGAAIAVIQDDEIVFIDGFGVANIDKALPVTGDTRFMIGSITKPLTTLMTASLVNMRRLTWSTRIQDVLPDFQLADRDITSRLEIRHTFGAGTGMPRRDMDVIFRTKDVLAADRLADMREMLPTTALGETFQYSNYLVAAGGYAAARAFSAEGDLETAYATAMRELVFVPLGMKRSSVAPLHGTLRGDAEPHAVDFAGNTVAFDAGMERCFDTIAPAGGVWSTAADLACYVLHELRNEGSQTRWRPQTRIDASANYGLGLFLTTESGLSVIGHGGNTLGFTSDMFFLPQSGVGCVLLTNLAGVGAFRTAVRQRFFELFFSAPEISNGMVGSAQKSLRSVIESRRRRISVASSSTDIIRDWVGVYHCKELGTALIKVVQNGYRADFEGWSSDLGIEMDPHGAPLIALTSPPWSGALSLHPGESKDSLIFADAQMRYVFLRQSD